MRASVLVMIAACGGGGVTGSSAPVAPVAPAVAVADASVAPADAADVAPTAPGGGDVTGTGSTTGGFDDSNIYGGVLVQGGTGARRPPPDGAHLVLGQPTITGDLDHAIVRRYLKRNIQKLTSCYEKQLLAKPGIAGTVTLAFTIAAAGTVSRSTASGVDADVSSCMAAVVATIAFPKPKTGEVVVSYPFELVPPKS